MLEFYKPTRHNFQNILVLLELYLKTFEIYNFFPMNIDKNIKLLY